jgi:hypothetical protein
VSDFIILNGVAIDDWSDLSSAGDGTGLNASLGPYLYDDGSTIGFNETKLNATIDDRAVSGSLDGTGGWTNSSTETNTTLNVFISGDLTLDGNVSINQVLTLTPTASLPNGTDGALIMYDNGGQILPCYYNGSAWNYFNNSVCS